MLTYFMIQFNNYLSCTTCSLDICAVKCYKAKRSWALWWLPLYTAYCVGFFMYGNKCYMELKLIFPNKFKEETSECTTSTSTKFPSARAETTAV